MEQITLYFKNGSSDKVYQATLDDRYTGWVVEFAYGRRGTTLTLGTKTAIPVSYEKAKAIYDKLVKEKQGKGYTVGEGGVPYSGTPQEERDTGIHCQLLNSIEESEVERYLSDDAYCLEEKHDGRRLLVQKKGGVVTGINRRGLVVPLPETIGASARACKRDFIIDGEAVGDNLYAFDILSCREEDLRHRWYVERRSSLIKILRQGKPAHIHQVETAYENAHKRELFNRCKSDGKEGVVFKHKLGLYAAGRPASGGSQFKFKFCETASCLVYGINQKRSVEVMLLDSEKWVPVGNVTIPANHDVPGVGEVVEVRYLYAFKGGSLFQPVYLGQRDDVPILECLLSQLKFKAEPPAVAA
ncbi:hypothetical protein BH09VER1_BH09VER1_23940 [soil metagenome]